MKTAKKKHDMPHFTEQDRPKKVKDIYRALKREHPGMPAEMKARIAARQGKPGKQKQGPPYKAPIKERYKGAEDPTPFTPDEIGEYRQFADTEREKAHTLGKRIAYPGLGAALGGLLLGGYGMATDKKLPAGIGKLLGAGGLTAAGLGGLHALHGSLSHSDRSMLANLAEAGRGSTEDIDRYAQGAHRYEPEFGGMMGRELKDVHPQMHSEIRDARQRAMIQALQDRMETHQMENRAARSSEKTSGIKDKLLSPFRRVGRAFMDPVAKATGAGIEKIISESGKAGVRGTQDVAKDVGEKLINVAPALAASTGLGAGLLGGASSAALGGARTARETPEEDPEYAKKIIHDALKSGLISGGSAGLIGGAAGGGIPYFLGRMLKTVGSAEAGA